MCIETDHNDDRTKRFKRRKFSNAKQRYAADAEKPIKAIKVARQPMFESDDPLAGINLRRVKSLAELRDLE